VEIDSLNSITLTALIEVEFPKCFKCLIKNQFIALKGKNRAVRIRPIKSDLSQNNVNIDLLNTLLPQDYQGFAKWENFTFEQVYSKTSLDCLEILACPFGINKFPVGL